MKVVVDAGAIVAFLSRDTSVDKYFASATSVTAPDLAVAEVFNVCWKLRRAHLTTPLLDAVLGFFERIVLQPSIAFARDADTLSRRLDHSIYDCLYAAVALREGACFVTGDRRFARKLAGMSLDVVTF